MSDNFEHRLRKLKQERMDYLNDIYCHCDNRKRVSSQCADYCHQTEILCESCGGTITPCACFLSEINFALDWYDTEIAKEQEDLRGIDY